MDNFRKSIALRIDDVGASTKLYEVYSKSRIGNFLFLKYVRPFKAWAPYQELSENDWLSLFEILENHGACATVGVTATWVDGDGSLTPFPIKYPQQAKALKSAHDCGIIEIANHGLTHCVVGDHLPRLFSSNRNYHREFWAWVPEAIHYAHVRKSQQILQDWLEQPVTTFIPPGNVYTEDTLDAATKYGLLRVNTTQSIETDCEIRIIDETNIFAFHDRDLVVRGMSWLDDKLAVEYKNTDFYFVKDLD